MFFFPFFVNHRQYWGFARIYRIFGLLTLFLPMLVLANWGRASYIAWDPDIVEGLYQVAGFVFSAGVVWLGIRKNWADTVNTGNTFFVIFLYTKFFDWWWEIMPKYLFFLVIALTFLLLLFVYKRVRLQSQLKEDSYA